MSGYMVSGILQVALATEKTKQRYDVVAFDGCIL